MKQVLCLWLLCATSIGVCAQETGSTEFAYDHLVVFVHNDAFENWLLEIGFTPAEKLYTKHTEQGTCGKYFLFYNTYVELLYLEDSTKIKENEQAFGSNYLIRWSEEGNPFGVGINMNPFDTNTTKYDFTAYGNTEVNGEYYLMSLGNKNGAQPMVYASMPKRAYKRIEGLKDIDERVEEPVRTDLKQYVTHTNGIKKLTNIELSGRGKLQGKNNTLLAIETEVVINKADKPTVELHFDNQQQGKMLLYEGSFKFIIKY